MLKLAELQDRFAAALDDETVGGTDAWVVEDGIAAERRISVYRNNSRIAQDQALAGIYPAVRALVGEAFFEQMADRYRMQYPSSSGDLRAHGGALADFLTDFQPAARLPYLSDVARLEWAWHECFHAAAEQSLDASGLAALAARPEAGMRLALVPASRLLASPYPVADIWAFALDPERQRQGLNLDVLDEAYLLIARPGPHVDVMEITAAQFCWLRCIVRGATPDSASEQVLSEDPDFDLAGNLATFVGLGVITLPREGGIDHDIF